MTGALREVAGATGLTRRYVDGRSVVEAIRGVDLSLPAGSFSLVRGPSGSGKTTLLGLLGGVIAPTSGEVRLDGEPITHLRDHHRTRLRRTLVGMVFQDLGLIPGMTLMENVLLPLVPGGGASGAERSRGRGLLDRLGIAALASRRVELLSGGERQRGAIARALLPDPQLLLFDEPTAHVGSGDARALVDLLCGLRDEGRTVLVATHDERLAGDPRLDRVFNLVDGSLR